jgi:hypothetical protein
MNSYIKFFFTVIFLVIGIFSFVYALRFSVIPADSIVSTIRANPERYSLMLLAGMCLSASAGFFISSLTRPIEKELVQSKKSRRSKRSNKAVKSARSPYE